MTAPKVCRQCRAPVALARLDHVEGEAQGLRIAIDGMPAYTCDKGHRRFAIPDFPVRLIDALARSEAVTAAPAAVKKGLLRKRYHCAACGGELPGEPGTHAAARMDLDWPDAGAFAVELSIPVARCTACNRDIARPQEEVQGAIMAAVAHAFRAAGIPPG